MNVKDVNKILLKLSGDCVGNPEIIDTVGSLAENNVVTIAHGAGAQISDALSESGIAYEYDVSGRRITTEEEISIIKEIVGDVGLGLKRELDKYYQFEVYDFHKIHAQWIDSNFTGIVSKIDDNLDYKIIPCLGMDDNFNVLNINADDIASYIAQNFDMDQIYLITKRLQSPGQTLKKDIAALDNTTILEADSVPKYFDNIQNYSIKTYTSYNEINAQEFCSLVEDGFACEQGTRRLVDNYFNIVDIKKIFLGEKEGMYLGAIVIEDTGLGFSYMDKFVTRKKYQKNGIGKKLFETALKEEKKMCWRAKSDNPVIDFYKKIASGYSEPDEWHCFWKALDSTEIPSAVDYCLSKEETLVRVADKQEFLSIEHHS